MGLVDETEFHFFHFFPYTDLPADHRESASLWVDFSNANYDPRVGHDLYLRYLDEMLLPRWLRRVDVPTLVVWGDEDRLLPIELAAPWAALLPDATVATFPDAGHLVLDESPAAVAAVSTFLGRS
jgi:pimeloyl-ACP methyl ester carboxylesterase